MQDFDNDSSAKVGVLYGVGGNFCAGFDLKELSGGRVDHLAPFGDGPMVMSMISFFGCWLHEWIMYNR